MNVNNKIKAVEEISKYAKVFISSEEELPQKLKKYKLNLPSEKINDLLYFASLTFGDSSTIASESAVLGTPAIFIDNVGRGYTEEEEKKYGLVYNFSESKVDQKLSIKKAVKLLTDVKSRSW
jgi:predicted glycosyltransferase